MGRQAGWLEGMLQLTRSAGAALRPLPLQLHHCTAQRIPPSSAHTHLLRMPGSSLNRLFSELTASSRTRTGTTLSKSRSGTGGWPAGRQGTPADRKEREGFCASQRTEMVTPGVPRQSANCNLPHVVVVHTNTPPAQHCSASRHSCRRCRRTLVPHEHDVRDGGAARVVAHEVLERGHAGLIRHAQQRELAVLAAHRVGLGGLPERRHKGVQPGCRQAPVVGRRSG